MAITNNIDLVNHYDGNFQIVSIRVLPNEAPHSDEHAAQCIAIEVLRELLASGLTVQQYNDLTEEAWQALAQPGIVRAGLNVNAPGPALSIADKNSGMNLGGNYFEHGYAAQIETVTADNKVQFTRIGGI